MENKPFDQNKKIDSRVTAASTAFDEAEMGRRNLAEKARVASAASEADQRRSRRFAAKVAALIPATVISVGLVGGANNSESPGPAQDAPAAVAENNVGVTPDFDLNDRDAAVAWSQQAVAENQAANEDERMAHIGRSGGIDPNQQP